MVRSSAPAAAEATDRRPRGSLTPRLVIDAAFRLSERDGAVTFQSLGRELQAHPTAIYRHFRDKDELMRGLVDALHAELLDQLGPVRQDWRDELRAVALTLREIFVRHPAIAQHAAVRTARTEHEFLVVERLIGAVRAAGLSAQDAANYYRVIGDACLGFSALDAAFFALPQDTQADDLRAWQVEYQLLDSEEFPNIHAVAEHLPPVADRSNYERFIDLMIAGLEARASI